MGETETVSGKLPLAQKTGYGSIEFSNAIMFTAFMTFGLFFFTDIVGLSPSFAGAILAIGTLWDAITDPLLGIISDKSKNKYGRRRPFLLGVAIPFGIVCWLLFTNWGFGEVGTKVYFILIVILYYTAMTVLDVPYTALGAEMTPDYDERTSLNTWRALFCQVGTIFGGALPIAIAAKLGDMTGSISTGWSYTGLFIGVLASAIILFGWRMTRGGELFPEDTHVNFLDIFTGPFRNKPFLFVIGFYSVGIMSIALAASFFIYYLKDFMMYDEEAISLAMAILFVPTVLWVPLVDFISKRYSKRVSWVFFSSVSLIAIICLYFFVQPGNDIALYIFMVMTSSIMLIPYQVGWSIIPDCIEIDEYKTGARREGLYYGIVTFIQKGGSALILWIGGILLEMSGYNAELAVQAPETKEGIRVILFGGQSMLLVLGIVLVLLFPLTREKHRAILKAIKARKEGGVIDESSFKECVS